MRKTTEERFWCKVNKTKKCWDWIASMNPKGYGYFGDPQRRRVMLAHRYSWELHNGAIPEGAHVLHRCDNPACIRPSHLFLGSELDNHNDAIAKERKSPQPIPRRQFSHNEVHQIRKLYRSQEHWPRNVARPYSLRGLAQLFNVSFGEIGHIVNRRIFRNIL